MKKSKTTFSKAWAKVIAKAWVDEEFKQKLLKNPEKVLKEMGIAIPSGVKLELHEQKAKKVHLILPAKPAGVLSEQELRAVAAAGATVLHLAKEGRPAADRLELSSCAIKHCQ